MKSINKEILNPWFFSSFIGSLIMIPFCTWLYYQQAGIDASFYQLLASSVIYIIGVFGLTGLGNVPLNGSLDKFDIALANAEEIKAKRESFEIPWNRFHFVRTIANATAFALLLLSIIEI